ncbi:MAG: 4Fe-4S dicluster domain-containing protein [Syntrophomonas sp.]
MKKYVVYLIPLLIGTTLSAYLAATDWIGFWCIFAPVGASISLGFFINASDKVKDKDLGRKVSLSLVALDLLVFLGFMQHENLQLEETVFYAAYFINTGIFARVLIHYAIAKVFGPLVWGRGYCGWGCYTAAVLEWLPIKENRAIPAKYTYIRIPVFILSILIPFLVIQSGYDYLSNQIHGPSYGYDGFPFQEYKVDQFIWFLVGNIIYYITAVALAFKFQKKRAFCKICCPVSLVMKAQTRISLLKRKPSGIECIECGKCNKNCPMDVDVMSYISQGKRIASSECILCGICAKVCPVQAIK